MKDKTNMQLGLTEKRCVTVADREGLCQARGAVRNMLEAIGISSEVILAQLLTIVDELGNNILRHGGRGRLCIATARAAGRTGFRITAEDRGAGITDLPKALTPGYSEDKGMGMGLNLLRAISDDIVIANQLTGGAVIEVWKWI